MEAKTMKRQGWMRWIRKFGFWGFLFFLAKGLLWLALGYWLVK